MLVLYVANRLRQIAINTELASMGVRKLVLNARIATERNKNVTADLVLELDELKVKENELREELASLTDFKETDRELKEALGGNGSGERKD